MHYENRYADTVTQQDGQGQDDGAGERAVKRALIPGYGRKGMGLLKDPERAIKNKIYKKTTFSILDLFK